MRWRSADATRGAGGTLGANVVAKAAPDGYTLLVPHVGLAVNETLYPKKSYDALKDLVPVSLLVAVAVGGLVGWLNGLLFLTAGLDGFVLTAAAHLCVRG